MIVFSLRRKSDGKYLVDLQSVPVLWGPPLDAKRWKSSADAGWAISELRTAGGLREGDFEVVPMEELPGRTGVGR